MSRKLVMKRLLPSLVAVPLALGFGQSAQAVLNAVDPGPYLAANGFFPAWYQDTNGLALDLCLSAANIAAGAVPGGVGGPACTLVADPGIFDPALPISFPGNFPPESFYSTADAAFTVGGVDVTYVANLEAAFGANVPQAGQQITFARIRMRITLPATAPGGNYTVTHPYGVEVFSVAEGGGIKVINATRDIGVAPGIFTGALGGNIGPFLRDASLAPGVFIPSSVPDEVYIGDPNTPRPVVGSPFGTNFVRVDGPPGFASVESRDQFIVMGKVHTGALPTPAQIERTSYDRTTDPLTNKTVAQQDIFVKAPPSDAAAVSATDANGGPVTLTDNDINGAWYGQSLNDPSGITAPTVSVTASATVGVNTPTTNTSPLVDVVTISRAEYNAGTLTVEAASSDEVSPPILTVNGTNLTPTGVGVVQSATIGGLTIPPATITVTSANGGSDTEEVVVVNP